MPSERKSVLVVDDDPDVRSIVRDNIHRISRQAVIQEASDGLEALLRAERQKFDLIITDLKMPKKDGIRLLEVSHGSTRPFSLIESSFYPAVLQIPNMTSRPE